MFYTDKTKLQTDKYCVDALDKHVYLVQKCAVLSERM